MIRNVYHTYSQACTVIPEAIRESCSSYNLIWICGKTLLQSELCLNGIRYLLTLWTHRVLMPSRIVLISSGSVKKFASTTKPSLTIEPSSVAMFRSGYTGYMAFVQYLFAFYNNNNNHVCTVYAVIHNTSFCYFSNNSVRFAVTRFCHQQVLHNSLQLKVLKLWSIVKSTLTSLYRVYCGPNVYIAKFEVSFESFLSVL